MDEGSWQVPEPPRAHRLLCPPRRRSRLYTRRHPPSCASDRGSCCSVDLLLALLPVPPPPVRAARQWEAPSQPATPRRANIPTLCVVPVSGPRRVVARVASRSQREQSNTAEPQAAAEQQTGMRRQTTTMVATVPLRSGSGHQCREVSSMLDPSAGKPRRSWRVHVSPKRSGRRISTGSSIRKRLNSCASLRNLRGEETSSKLAAAIVIPCGCLAHERRCV